MQADAPAPVRRSAPWAAVASLIAPGLGHLYVGQPYAAAALLAAFGVGTPALVTAIVAADPPSQWLFVLAVLATWAPRLVLAVDALLRARRLAGRYAMRPCNRPQTYVGFVALSLLVQGAASLLISEHVLATFHMPAGSMEPTIHQDEHFVVTKLGARGAMPARGEVIVFRYPEDPTQVFVKRVIGVAGDTVEDTAAGLAVNGAAWPQRPCERPVPGSPPRLLCRLEQAPDGSEHTIAGHDGVVPFAPVTLQVPAGHIYVRGDNRGNSHDSHSFGPVAVDHVLGRARAIFLPLERFGPLE